ncbi:hypothetical protein DAPPUDRAFT_307326 [Daphnia pulex]|uniref:Uncharacterized protein n=1 Tax=Daphnia pulex TaxID=6669 RepID=E9H1R1_DAPPU|nr:hypothetical protein DAPPUDRAFT_307326 [Daphnia pulex]|eukprot:EFX74217.1 hypothetical protein DAPPUDRAFT_307326 [Daphnia pulex]
MEAFTGMVGDPIVHVSDTRDPSRIQRAKTNKETKEKRKGNVCNAQLAGAQAERMESRERERGRTKNRSHYICYFVALCSYILPAGRASQLLRNCYVLGTT